MTTHERSYIKMFSVEWQMLFSILNM